LSFPPRIKCGINSSGNPENAGFPFSRLRAEAPACTKRFGEGRHFGVQARSRWSLAMTNVKAFSAFAIEVERRFD